MSRSVLGDLSVSVKYALYTEISENKMKENSEESCGFFRYIGLFLGDFAGVLLLAIVVLVNLEIALRYIFGKSTLIADEYSGYLLAWLTLLGFGFALEMGQALRVEFVLNQTQGAIRSLLEFIGAILGALLAIVLAYSCLIEFLTNLRFGTLSTQPSATPLWLPQMVMPLAFAWLAVLNIRTAKLRLLDIARRGTVK